MTTPKHTLREAWLQAAIEALRPLFAEVGTELPESIRCSVGFMSGGGPNRIGECHYGDYIEDGVPQIFIHPKLDKTGALGVLVHELIHAVLGAGSGHGKEFRKVALAVGLEGKMTATSVGDLLADKLKEILAELGDYPHAVIESSRPADAPKKQSTRMIKLECPGCGFIARTSRKWIEEVGAPTCLDGNQFEIHWPEEGS